MNINVPVTRTVEVHTHRFYVAARIKGVTTSEPDLSLICACGNGFGLETKDSLNNGVIVEKRISLDELLHLAAEEQDKRHRDW